MFLPSLDEAALRTYQALIASGQCLRLHACIIAHTACCRQQARCQGCSGTGSKRAHGKW